MIPNDISGFECNYLQDNRLYFPTSYFSSEDSERCMQFAIDFEKTTDYVGQDNRETKIDQSYRGKLAEVMVVREISKEIAVAEPDFRVKEEGEAWNWGSDTKTLNGKVNIEIKSSDRRKDTSWLFQCSGERRDIKFFPYKNVPVSNNLFVVFVFLDTNALAGRILAVIRAPNVVTLFEDCDKDKFNATPQHEASKRAVYFARIMQKGFVGNLEELKQQEERQIEEEKRRFLFAQKNFSLVQNMSAKLKRKT